MSYISYIISRVERGLFVEALILRRMFQLSSRYQVSVSGIRYQVSGIKVSGIRAGYDRRQANGLRTDKEQNHIRSPGTDTELQQVEAE